MARAVRNITSIKRNDVYKGKFTTIIPAAGIGKRMKCCGPKALIEINHLSIIERQLNLILSLYPETDIIVGVGFEAHKIKNHLKDKYNVRYVKNELFETTNVLHTIGLCLQASIYNKVLIIYGDLIFNQNTIKNLIDNKSKIVIDNKQQFRDEEVGVIYQNNKVTNFSHGIPIKWSQIVFLAGSELEEFEKMAISESCNSWFGYEALNELINRDYDIYIKDQIDSKIIELDYIKDIEIAQRLKI